MSLVKGGYSFVMPLKFMSVDSLNNELNIATVKCKIRLEFQYYRHSQDQYNLWAMFIVLIK